MTALVAAVAFAAAVSGCAVGTTNADGRLTVTTTTTVFADLVSNVGGDLVAVTSLVPRNGDVHTFEPRPADIRAVAAAKLLLMNGLGLDDWLAKMATNAAAPGTPIVKLAENLPGVTLLPGEGAGTENPHLFMDPRYTELYVDRIAAALAAVDPAHASAYEANARTYRQKLEALDGWVRSQVESIPVADRKIVTFHDAFPYYAREYGIDIVGVAVEAPGQDPSAGQTADLIAAIRRAGVKAVFSEAQFPAKLVQQIAAETGATVVSNLYDDALGDPPVDTYEGVIRWDTEQLVKALR